MQQYGDVVLKANPSGVATMGKKAEVTVYLAGTRNRASLFVENGGAVLGNPFTANDDGSFRFCAADGSYDLYVGGVFIKTVTLFDPTAPTAASSVEFQAAGTGAAVRSVQAKLGELPSVEDFAGSDVQKFQALEAVLNGGVALIPHVTYALGTYQPAALGSYINNGDTLLSTYLYNPGETAGVTTAKHLTIGAFTTANLNKKRFQHFDRVTFFGAGSTIALTGTGDYVRGTNASKTNFATTTQDGEIGGHYTVVRQGGGSASDCSAELYDVVTYSTSFAAVSEGATAYVNPATGVATDQIRLMTAFLNKGTGDMGGTAVIVQKGAASNVHYIEVDNGATAQNFLKFVDLTTGLWNPITFALGGDGAQTTFMRNALGSALGGSIVTRSMNAFDGDRDEVRERLVRTTDGGTDWSTSEWRIERVVDNSVFAGGVYFGNHATYGHTVVLGDGGTRNITMGSNLYLGFNGATPIQRPVMPTNASDLASAIALVNFIKGSLVTYGLAQ